MEYRSPSYLRLEEDYKKMQELVRKSPFITFEISGEHPPNKYIISYTCKGIKLDDVSKQVVHSNFHKVEIYLPTTYPRIRPNLEWLTPIYHPNIGTNNQVCLGGWSPSESLDRLCVRLGEMIQYKNFDEYDPINASAAAWALKNHSKLPIDLRPLESNESQLSGGFEIKLS
ncbi:MAG: ubiquitin-conjugating enzyme E2 [Nitrospirota bacterium]